MGNSLQDQLLKSGLANKKQAVRAKKAKNSKEKLKRTGHEVEDEAAALAKAAEAEKVAKDRQLNRQKTQEAERKAVQAQIRQLISMNLVARNGDVEFRFTDDTTIRTISIGEHQRQGLVRGTLAIVRHADTFGLVPQVVAEKIAERDESHIVLSNENTSDDEIPDEYADYQVPDDLMW